MRAPSPLIFRDNNYLADLSAEAVHSVSVWTREGGSRTTQSEKPKLQWRFGDPTPHDKVENNLRG